MYHVWKIIDMSQKTLGKDVKDCGCWRRLPRIEIIPGTMYGRLKVLEMGESAYVRESTILKIARPSTVTDE